MKRREGSTRKVRTDKKVDVQPTISIELKDQLYMFSHLCELPVKDVGEKFCETALTSELIIEEIRQWFRRNYHFKNHITIGQLERPRLKLKFKGSTGKISIKFPQDTYNKVCELAFSMDLPPTTTVTVLIKKCLFNREFMENFMRTETRHLTESQRDKAKLFLRQIWGYR